MRDFGHAPISSAECYDDRMPRRVLIALLTLALVTACTIKEDPMAAPRDVAAPPADALKTASGLASKVLIVGFGAVHPNPESTVTVNYVGWTTDGKMVDASSLHGGPIDLQAHPGDPGLDRRPAADGQGREAPLLDPGEARLRREPRRRRSRAACSSSTSSCSKSDSRTRARRARSVLRQERDQALGGLRHGRVALDDFLVASFPCRRAPCSRCCPRAASIPPATGRRTHRAPATTPGSRPSSSRPSARWLDGPLDRPRRPRPRRP